MAIDGIEEKFLSLASLGSLELIFSSHFYLIRK